MKREAINGEAITNFVTLRYGITTKELFESKEVHPEFFGGVIRDIFQEFPESLIDEQDGKLHTFNPYTQRLEPFSEAKFHKVQSLVGLTKGLTYTRQQRILHLNKSFYKELSFVKEGAVEKRSREIKDLSKERDIEELER